MLVRMLVEVSGSRDGVPWPERFGLIDLPDDEGAQLCAAGMAEPVRVDPLTERAVEPDPELRTGPLVKRSMQGRRV